MELESSAIAGIFVPDVLTRGQYYDGIRADNGCARPIKRLMLAVLEDAMRCYLTYANSRSRPQRRLFVEAEGVADGSQSRWRLCLRDRLRDSGHRPELPARGPAPMAPEGIGRDESASLDAASASDRCGPDRRAA